MGVFEQTIALGGPQQTVWEEVSALVDTGSTYTVIPAPVLNRLGVVPIGRQQFRLADDSLTEREVGQVAVRVDGRTRITVVVFGGERGPVLLGAVTLEGLGLGVDPVNQKLIPVTGYLLQLPDF